MSARALKRLQKEKGLGDSYILNKIEGSSSSDDNSQSEVSLNVAAPATKSKVKTNRKKKNIPGNSFALLCKDLSDQDDTGGENAELLEEETKSLSIDVTDNCEIKTEENAENPKQPNLGDMQATKKKNRKQKKKKKQKSDTSNDIQDNEEEDEIERGIREVNAMYGCVQQQDITEIQSSSSLRLDTNSLLCVEVRNLNPENEVRRKFGGYAARGERRPNSHRRVLQRSHWLVAPRPTWQSIGKSGISMKSLGKKRNCNMFIFEHNAHYQKVQFQFQDAVESLDHNNIIALLQQHQYHVDSLLQLSEICKMSEDYQTAAELIEKALYVLEMGFHPLFNVTQGNCRLEYKRKENRAFFFGLFRHIHYIANRACYVTALEFCKLILSLSPDDDPLGIILMIDYYALKAEKYEFLLNLYNERVHEDGSVMHMLLNFAFSVPMATFHMNKGSSPEADKQLQKALMMFPSTLLPLMDKCGVTLDKEISEHPFFDRVKELRDPVGLRALSQLFICRNFSLWKQAEVLTWLTSNCKEVINQVDKDNSIGFKEEKRRMENDFYQRVHRPVDRHIILSEYKEAIAYLPPHIKNQSMMTLDPLPPADSVLGYSRPNRTNSNNDSGGILSLFLRSLLPSYGTDGNSLQQQQQQQQLRVNVENHEDEAAAERPEAGSIAGNVQEGARGLVGALMQLVDTMTYRGDLEGVAPERHSDEEQWEDE